MSDRPTIGLALIARNEAANLPRLLASIEGAFDRVVLLDTGSTDGTVAIFETWALRQPGTWGIGNFEWCDDFSAARIAADSLLMGAGIKPLVDWTSWADCDDTIIGAKNLRDLAAQAAPEVTAMICAYDYAQHPATGECICTLSRERLVRAGAGEWVGRVHEAQVVPGVSVRVDPATVHWHHHKQEAPDSAGKSNARNLKILRRWVREEPENARVLAYVGTELAIRGQHKQAIGYYRRYLKLIDTWDQERAQICRKLAHSLMILDRADEAQQAALIAVVNLPSWPDSYLTLAEVALSQDHPANALVHARRALELGVPETLLIVNPMDYTVHPHRLMAGAYRAMNQLEECIEHAEIVVEHNPDDQGIRIEYRNAQILAKREHTAQTYLRAAQQLIGHDEQLKALHLLENCVPHFATDHPQIVAARSEVREHLAWMHSPKDFAEHYDTGGSKPEDFHGDEMIEEIGASLPRVGFLLNGLDEQREAA